MKSFYIRTALLLLLAVFTTGIVLAASVRVEVIKPRGKSSIGVGDAFWIEIRANDVSSGVAQPRSVKGARILYFDNPESSYQMSFDGHTSRQSISGKWVLTLRATEEGKFTFGPVSVGGVKSNTVSYTIGAKGSSQPVNKTDKSAADPNNSSSPKFIGKGDSQLFLRASVSKNTAYEQEALTYTVKLYSTYDNIRFVGATAAPTFDGFTVEETNNVNNQLTFESYNGKTYATAVIARYVIFPQLSGKLKVNGNTYTVAVDAAEYYHDPYFMNMTVHRPIQLDVTPNDLVVEAKPLPAPKPANFSGGVGKFSVSSSLQSANLVTNQAFTVVYTVSGRGNLKYLKMPDLNQIFPKEFEVFDPVTDVKANISDGNLEGSVRFDFSVVPLEMGDFELPSIDFVYFNPETGKYETATARGYKVHVAKGKNSDKMAMRKRLKFDADLLPVSCAPVDNTPLVYRFVFWLLFIVPTVAVSLVLVLYRKRLKELSDLDLLRSKKAGSVARKRLKKALFYLKRNNKERFYKEMLDATWGFLSDRLHIPLSELSRDNVSQNLAKAGCSDHQISELLQLLDDCEFAQYAGSGSGNMQDDYERGSRIINLFASTINV